MKQAICTAVIFFILTGVALGGGVKGSPGGTYMASDVDESSIIFEPYNLDNSVAVFQDGPKAAHGIRLITKDVERRALQITLEGYSTDKGWTGE